MRGKAIVVGAGIAGLTAANRLKNAGFDVSVIEAGNAVGGRMSTVERQGFRFDTGAIVLTHRYSQMLRLAKDVGLSGEIVAASSALAIPRDGRMHRVYADSPLKNLTTSVVSWRGKLSAIALLRDVARVAPYADWFDLERLLPFDRESVRDYLTRQCSAEMRDALIGPLFRGLYLEDIGDMSVIDLLTILNNFYGAPLFTFGEGVGSLPRALARGLDVKLESRVVAVEEDDHRVRVIWHDTQAGECGMEADACVIALPAPHMAAIFPQLDPELRNAAAATKYSRILNVQLALDQPTKEKAVAVMLPVEASAELYSVYLDHNKNPLQMPTGKGIATVFWDHAIASNLWGLDDEAIVSRTAIAAAKVLPELGANVLFGHVTRHDIGIVIPAPGDYRRLAPLAVWRRRAKRIHIAGDYLAGGSTNSALCAGDLAARRICERLA